VSAGKINFTAPQQSITLLVLPAQNFSFQQAPTRPNGKISLNLFGQVGQTFILQTSTNLATWQPVSTNVLASTQMNFLLPTSLSQAFYRVKLMP
jgi:hypothetical protein